MGSLPSLLRRGTLQAASAVLRGAIIGVEVFADLTPGVRMTSRRRLPHNMSAGLLGAEVATWAAVSPSLLPRPWWVTAANVAVGQSFGHLAAATSAYALKRGLRAAGLRPQDRVTTPIKRGLHWAIAGMSAAQGVAALFRQQNQAELVGTENNRGPAQALGGLAAGTLGYGALLLLGEATQQSVDQLSKRLNVWLPALAAWPIAAAGVGILAWEFTDHVMIRRFLHRASINAAAVNRSVFPGSQMPWEPERSGSPWSYESWTAVGSQGRAMLTKGPRARDIAAVMEYEETHEPIRIFIGLVPGRSSREAARRAMSELERTGAFHRNTLVMQVSSGSGWINNYGISAYEFLTAGDCATVAVQYSYLPSAFSYVMEKDIPIQATRELLRAIRIRLDSMPEENRPKFYLAGESLGAYGILDMFEDIEELYDVCDGAVFTGPPRFTTLVRTLALQRPRGSLERLPLVDAGRHTRFVITPAHLRHDAFGHSYQQPWQSPRVVIAQHASDPIVYWEPRLAWRRPDWMREPGGGGIKAPATMYSDTFAGVRWIPFISFWQIGLDQINSLNVPGGHGHNYYAEMFWYWEAVLGDQARAPLTHRYAGRMKKFVDADQFWR